MGGSAHASRWQSSVRLGGFLQQPPKAPVEMQKKLTIDTTRPGVGRGSTREEKEKDC